MTLHTKVVTEVTTFFRAEESSVRFGKSPAPYVGSRDFGAAGRGGSLVLLDLGEDGLVALGAEVILVKVHVGGAEFDLVAAVGTGVADQLVIVKHVAEVHQAQVKLESKPQEGTKVTVEF